jgi:hypothetical protein
MNTNEQFNGNQTAQIFNISQVAFPYIVQVFTLLRQSEIQINELHYPELRCDLPCGNDELAGDTASKLTMALSIHLDYFLGLTCSESSRLGCNAFISARFSNMVDADTIVKDIELKAADIIDTLMSLSV